jgi:hypothetical protein
MVGVVDESGLLEENGGDKTGCHVAVFGGELVENRLPKSKGVRRAIARLRDTLSNMDGGGLLVDMQRVKIFSTVQAYENRVTCMGATSILALSNSNYGLLHSVPVSYCRDG